MLALLGTFLLMPLVAQAQKCTVTIDQVEHCTFKVTYGSFISPTVVNSGDQVPKYTTLSIQATPEEGYMVTHYIINGQEKENTGSSLRESVKGDLTISAQVIQVRPCTVTITQPEHGTLKVTSARNEVQSGNQINSGSTLALELTPEAGYEIEYWIFNGKKSLPNEGADLRNKTFLKLMDDITITAQLKVAGTTTKVPVTIVNPEFATIKAYKGTSTYGYPELQSGEELEVGSDLTVKITPSDDFHALDYWLINNERVEKEASYFPDEKHLRVVEAMTISAVLKEAGYVITYNQPEAGGTLTVKVGTGFSAKEVASGSRVKEGAKLNITATVQNGYKLKHFLINNKVKLPDSPMFPSITEVATSDMTIEAVFEKLPACIVTITPFEHGTLKATYGDPRNPTIVANGDEVPMNTLLSLEAAVDPDYEFKHFLIGGVETASSYHYSNVYQLNITVQESVSIAVVAEKKPTTKVTIEPFEHGELIVKYGPSSKRIKVASGDEVPQGTMLDVDAWFDDGYGLDHFLVNGEPKPSDDTEYDYIELTVGNTPLTLSAVAKKTHGLVVVVQPDAAQGAMTGHYTDNGQQKDLRDSTWVALQTPVTFVVTPKEGYEMDHWMDNDARQDLDASKPNELTLTVTGDLTVEPVLKEKVAPQPTKYTVTMIQPKEGQGMMTAYYYNESGDKTALTSGNAVPKGTYVTFEVTPAEGYEMDHWMIDDKPVEGTSNTKGITVEGDLKVQPVLKAKAAPQPTTSKITIIQPKVEEGTMTVYTFDGYGDFVFIKDGQSVKIGTDLIFKVTPKEGYEMDYWMVNDERQELSTSTPNQKTITVTGDLKVKPVLKAKATPQPKTVNVKISYEGPGAYLETKYVEPNSSGNPRSIFGDKDIPVGSVVTVRLKSYMAGDYQVVYTNNGKPVPAEALTENGLVYTFTANEDAHVHGVISEKPAPAVDYTIKFEAGEGGKVTATVDMEPIESGAKIAAGTQIKILAEPNENYEIDQWLVGGEPVANTGLSFYYIKLMKDTNVKVTFRSTLPPAEYAVVVEPVLPSAEAGTVQLFKKDGSVIASGKTVVTGTEMYVEVKPADKYELETLQVNNTTIKAGDEKLIKLAGGGVKYAFTVTEATTIKATFKLVNAIEQLTESQIAVYVTNGGTRLEVAGAAEGAEVRLYDYTGQLLLTSTEHALDISALPAGSYIVLVGNYTTRIVK